MDMEIKFLFGCLVFYIKSSIDDVLTFVKVFRRITVVKLKTYNEQFYSPKGKPEEIFTKEKVNGIISNLVIVEVDEPAAQNEICFIHLRYDSNTRQSVGIIRKVFR